MGRPSKTTEFTHVEPFGRARRTGDLLEYHIGSTYHLAKASLSRLLQQFEKKVDFVIVTSYDKNKTEQENIKTFEKFPSLYRSLVGTMKVGAFELTGHWQEEDDEDTLERSWFFTNGDPNLSSEDFTVAAQALASQYNQTALIVSRQGVTTVETPEGRVTDTLTTAGAIENASLKLMKARREFDEGKREGIGYSELSRMKERRRDSTFVFEKVPVADQATPVSKEQEGKIAGLKPAIFVTVPVNNFSKWAFSSIGLNYPDW